MDLASDFLKPTEDNLKEFALKRSHFRRNPFHEAFLRISEAMTTRAASRSRAIAARNVSRLYAASFFSPSSSCAQELNGKHAKEQQIETSLTRICQLWNCSREFILRDAILAV